MWTGGDSRFVGGPLATHGSSSSRTRLPLALTVSSLAAHEQLAVWSLGCLPEGMQLLFWSMDRARSALGRQGLPDALMETALDAIED